MSARSLLVLAAAISLASFENAAASDTFGGDADVRAWVRNRMDSLRQRATREDKLAVAFADLNGDGRKDALAYLSGPRRCGSGGCNLYVLENRGSEFRMVARTTVTKLPIRVMYGGTNGWRDVGVWVSNASEAYEAVLRFDGQTYPANPTLEPRLRAGSAGMVVISGESSGGL